MGGLARNDSVTWTTLAGASGIVLHDGKLLMIRQRRQYGVHWEFPSGYYEVGETLEQTAAREVLEETAIAVEEHDRRRNVLAFFLATPLDPTADPRPQADEDIDDARYANPGDLMAEIHPLDKVVLDRWWESRATGSHVHADVSVLEDGRQSYSFR